MYLWRLRQITRRHQSYQLLIMMGICQRVAYLLSPISSYSRHIIEAVREGDAGEQAPNVYPHKWLPVNCRSNAGQKVRRSKTKVLPVLPIVHNRPCRCPHLFIILRSQLVPSLFTATQNVSVQTGMQWSPCRRWRRDASTFLRSVLASGQRDVVMAIDGVAQCKGVTMPTNIFVV